MCVQKCLKWSNFSFRNVYSFIELSEATFYCTTKMWTECLTNSGYLYFSSFSPCRKKCMQYKFKKLRLKMSLIAEMSWPAPAVGTSWESGPCQLLTFPVSFLHTTGFLCLCTVFNTASSAAPQIPLCRRMLGSIGRLVHTVSWPRSFLALQYNLFSLACQTKTR